MFPHTRRFVSKMLQSTRITPTGSNVHAFLSDRKDRCNIAPAFGTGPSVFFRGKGGKRHLFVCSSSSSHTNRILATRCLSCSSHLFFAPLYFSPFIMCQPKIRCQRTAPLMPRAEVVVNHGGTKFVLGTGVPETPAYLRT